MGKIYNWFARIFQPRVRKLEQQVEQGQLHIENLTYIINHLEKQVYHLSEKVSQQEIEIKQLKTQRQNA
jgi:predicted RNase H-like nuclease (RuvC/YqgF family)